jgi:hypothetical protein
MLTIALMEFSQYYIKYELGQFNTSKGASLDENHA